MYIMYITKDTNGTRCVVAIATLLAPVPFCHKPFATLKSGTEGPNQNTRVVHITLSLLTRLLGVDGLCLKNWECQY